jgi:diguanylate cyclase
LISLKKYLDMNPAVHAQPEPASSEQVKAALESYRSALLSIGKNGAHALPAVGSEMQQCLASLEKRLADNVTPATMKEVEAQVEQQLEQWGDRAATYFNSKTGEVKEILMVMARTAESVVERDKNYTGRFTDFTTRLRAIANLEDLTQVRASLMKGATELKTCVDQMAQDGQKLVAQLKAEVATYETKLKAAEDLAQHDALTGLSNRRGVEERIVSRIEQKKTFCVAVLDINGLKQVNDTHGHQAGDDLLKQFSQELKSGCGAVGAIGRWGGDEFMIVFDGDFSDSSTKIERLQKWVFGEYTLHLVPDSAEVRVNVDASIGLAQWTAGETMQQVIERADAVMYKEKQLAKKRKQ